MTFWWPWTTRHNTVIPFHRANELLRMGLELPSDATRPETRAIGDGVMVLQLAERLSSERVLNEDLAARKLSTSSHIVVGGSKEVLYATTAALDASLVLWGEEAVLTYWTAILNCRCAKGHDSGHVAK